MKAHGSTSWTFKANARPRSYLGFDQPNHDTTSSDAALIAAFSGRIKKGPTVVADGARRSRRGGAVLGDTTEGRAGLRYGSPIRAAAHYYALPRQGETRLIKAR